MVILSHEHEGEPEYANICDFIQDELLPAVPDVCDSSHSVVSDSYVEVVMYDICVYGEFASLHSCLMHT